MNNEITITSSYNGKVYKFYKDSLLHPTFVKVEIAKDIDKSVEFKKIHSVHTVDGNEIYINFDSICFNGNVKNMDYGISFSFDEEGSDIILGFELDMDNELYDEIISSGNFLKEDEMKVVYDIIYKK